MYRALLKAAPADAVAATNPTWTSEPVPRAADRSQRRVSWALGPRSRASGVAPSTRAAVKPDTRAALLASCAGRAALSVGAAVCRSFTIRLLVPAADGVTGSIACPARRSAVAADVNR